VSHPLLVPWGQESWLKGTSSVYPVSIAA
jgi:hypothetical protein